MVRPRGLNIPYELRDLWLDSGVAHRLALNRSEAGDAEVGEDPTRRVELVAGEDTRLARPLDLDEPPPAEPDDVHVHVRRRVLDVIKVENGFAKATTPTLTAATLSFRTRGPTHPEAGAKPRRPRRRMRR